MLKEQKIASCTIRVGVCDRIVIDAEKTDLPRTLRHGKAYSQDEAARMIGVSVLVLKDLRISGHFEVVHQVEWKRGYHELDIQAFTEKMIGLAPKETDVVSSATKSLTIANIMAGTYGIVHIKANVIRAILSREIRVLGKIDNKLSGLLVPHEQCRIFVRNERVRVYGGRTPEEAAESLKCNSESIGGLLKRGLLMGSRTLKGYVRITDESIADFGRKYLCIALLAKSMATSASALMAWCDEVNIPMITVSYGSQKQGFVRIEDRSRVLIYQPKKLKSGLDLNARDVTTLQYGKPTPEIAWM